MKKTSGGFTLVELLVTVMCCSLVTLAAMSLTMLGVRLETDIGDTASRRQTARILLTLLENLASDGDIAEIATADGDWALLDGDNNVLLLCSGGAVTTGAGAILMDGLLSSSAELDGTLLKFAVTTEDGEYSTSVYCRTAITDNAASIDALQQSAEQSLAELAEDSTSDDISVTYDGRYEFLTILASQYGSGGYITGYPEENGLLYAQWYDPGWDEDTAWCACFISWALSHSGYLSPDSVPKFAEVNYGISRFKSGAFGAWREPSDYDPVPGDLIFFDWDFDGSSEHVGAVFYVDADGGTVYTIEGNSGGSSDVSLHFYSLSDVRIMGYGVLDWLAA